MHQSAMEYGKRFFEIYIPYVPASRIRLLEIGSQNVNGSLRDVCPPGVDYVGLDFVPGSGVDYVIEDPYKLPFADESVDVVVSSSCFEHSEFFWLVFLEAMRVLKPSGLLYLNAPSNGFFHRWPVDSWRFYPDAGHSLVNWAKRNGYNPLLLESFVGDRSAGRVSEGGMWNDFVAVVLKSASQREIYPHRIVHVLEGFSNGFSSDREGILNLDERGPDFTLIETQQDRIDTLGRDLEVLLAAKTELDGQIAARDTLIASLNQAVLERDANVAAQKAQVAELGTRLEALRRDLQAANVRIQGMERSRSWRMTAPYRWLGTLLKAPLRSAAGTGLLSRLVVAALLLPAALVFYGGLGAFLRHLGAGRGAFADVIDGQAVIRERLLARNRLLRRLVFAGFSLAVRIQRAGSVKRSLGNFFRIIRTEGLGGVSGRMITTAPGMAADPVPTRVARAELPVLSEDIARRILVADYRVPRPDVSAGERATVGILRDLCAVGYEVVFLPNDMMPSPRYETELRAAGVHVVTHKSGVDYSAHYVEKHGSEFGAFYLIRVDVAETLLSVVRRVAPDARVIFHAPDLYFLREMREADLRNDQAARAHAMQTRDRELAMMSRSDRVVVVSPAEVPVLREVLPDTSISVFPVLYAPVVQNPPPYAKRKNIFFLGGFGHRPNVSAVQWFAAEVWPDVRKVLPELEFHIIGAEAPESVVALGMLPGIKVVGFVPDLDPVLENLRVGVAPLQYGAGIKGKVAVTMGAGIPCVCTEIAAEGMGIKNDVHALVENDPVRFAQAIVTLYKDEKRWLRLARNGQTLVRDKYGDAANRASLLKVLDQAQALPISLFINYCQVAEPVAVPNPGADAEVDVSIIVPVYNKWHLTRACLTSVVQTSVGSGVTYEVILADDGSTDETVRAAELFPGLRIVKTPKNLGFLRNCNNAATQARGRHILLLNNDTIVLPGWLESLYRTIESDSSIAIAGSKLLYPDGLIQEAGAALFSDGTAVNVGRGFGRFAEVFNLRREVDYISGASILIRKSFWDSVGGFDERYKIAYCEDSDLAMTARSVGMRVVYEPSSEVIHFEHQSYVEQAPSHNATLQNHNIAILLDKWRSVFDKDHLPVCEWYLAASKAERSVPPATRARRNEGKLNVLYFSPFPSHPASHGNRSTILQFGQYFQRLGHQVHFVLLQSHEYSEKDLEGMVKAWDTLDVLPFSNPMIADGSDIPFDGWYETGLGERIRLLCAKYDIDMVFCSYVFQSKMLEYVPDYTLKVIDTHDKMGDRYEMLRKSGQPLEFFSCTPDEEGAYLRRADVVVARREEEAHYFDSVTGRKTAIVVPHVEEPHFLERSFDGLKNVGIVASANRINLAIVRECLEAIDRKLAGNACPFTVHVAGQVKDMAEALPARENAVFKRPWVQMHGFVPDISKFYSDMDLLVSPVTMGTGINVKTVQAMAYGMPLVTTAWGIKGIETDEAMHSHRDLDALAASLLELKKRPDELRRLADVSRLRYSAFFEEAMRGFVSLRGHAKLQASSGFSPRAMARQADWISGEVAAERLAFEHRLREVLVNENVEATLTARCCLCGEVPLAYSFKYGWTDGSGKPVVNWRERLLCSSCGLNNRMRLIVHLLKEQVPMRRDATVYISEQTTELYRLLKSHLFPRLIGSEYLGDRCERGAELDGIRNEDLCQLSFGDKSLDAVLTFDVLEHIPDYHAAVREIFRCLKPAGYLVMTVPFNLTSQATLIRAEIDADGKVRHLLLPEYHGDPLNPNGGVLCFPTFGWDLLDMLRGEGFVEVQALDCWSSEFGYLGEPLVFIARKPGPTTKLSCQPSARYEVVPSLISHADPGTAAHPVCKVCGESTRSMDSIDRGMCVGQGERFLLGQTGEIATYHSCNACGFVFTDFFDAWSTETFAEKIYNGDYIRIDPDYVSTRPTQMGRWTADVFDEAPRTLRFLDYGSGNCILGDQLRANGFREVQSWDPFSSPTRPLGPFDVITCYEVLEHVVDPSAVFEEFRTLLAPGGVVLLSTHLVPVDIAELRSAWWYLGPRNGHISLFSAAAMSLLATRHGLTFRTNGKEFHILCHVGEELSALPLLMRARADWTGISY